MKILKALFIILTLIFLYFLFMKPWTCVNARKESGNYVDFRTWIDCSY